MSSDTLIKLENFSDWTFDDFRKAAGLENASRYEKIGFPDSFRKGKEQLIFKDICRKLTLLNSENKVILDIGPGCSDLPGYIISLCRENRHHLVLVDSQEMLDQLPNEDFITKIPGIYPDKCWSKLNEYASSIDVILSYSVIHYVFIEGNVFNFLDRSLQLLNEGGQFLIGDIPNVSKRKRFLSSSAGISYHKKNYSQDSSPIVDSYIVDDKLIDDGVLLGLQIRARNFGFHSYLLPQDEHLPMANRREDLLIIKP